MWWLKSSERRFSLPDWLSVYRIAAVPVLVSLLFFDNRYLFGSLLLVSLLTDAFDGFLARRNHTENPRGAQLDSIGDALTFVVGFLGVIWFEPAFVLENVILISAAFGLYFFQLLLAYWRYGMPSSFHTYLAKLSAIFQGTFMVWLFLLGIEEWLFYVAAALSIIETLEEIVLIMLLPKWEANVKGLYWVIRRRPE